MKFKISIKTFFYISISTLLLFISCKDNGIESEEGGIGIIVPGKSVEGIHLGDSKETVESKLGKTTSVGWADGQYRGWRLYDYQQSRDPNDVILEFYFIDNRDSYGPLDDITIGPKYEGKIKEGIGIVTTKYCLNGKKFILWSLAA